MTEVHLTTPSFGVKLLKKVLREKVEPSFSEQPAIRTSNGGWFAPFLLICVAWLLAYVFFNLDVSVTKYEIVHGCFAGFAECLNGFHTIARTLPGIKRSTYELLSLVVFFGLVHLLTISERNRRWYSAVIFTAGCVAAGMTAGELIGVLPKSGTSQDSFWNSLGRDSGIFSDPNAFGIAGYLLIGMYLCWATSSRKGMRWIAVILAFTWLFLTLYSGSRTLFIGLFTAAAVFIWLKNRRVGYALAGIVAIVLVTLQFLPLESLQHSTSLPSGLTRLIHSLDLTYVRSALFSREVFWIIAIKIWLSSPVIGIGFNQFESVFPAVARASGYALNGWVDNPNSFYLGVMAELGLVGVAALLYAACYFRKRSGSLSEVVSFCFCCGFGVQLMFGPHLDFLEVGLLAPVLIAGGFSRVRFTRSRIWTGHWLLIALFICGSGYVKESQGSRGIWGSLTTWPPVDPWISRRANFELPCGGGTAKLKFHAPFIRYSSTPLQVTLTSGLGEQHSLTVTNSDKVEVEFRCVEDPQIPGKVLPLRISARCSRYWIPAKLGISRDRRPLCIQLLR